jgi:hypothetical protein
VDILQFAGEYRFLSNFWLSPVQLDGVMYPTVEHAYQAAKTADVGARRQIQACPTPGQAKRMGRHVPIRPDWESSKLEVMYSLVRQKFRDPELGRRLLATGRDALIEGNEWGDRYWGVCRGTGENHLGRILMRVRQEIAPPIQNAGARVHVVAPAAHADGAS